MQSQRTTPNSLGGSQNFQILNRNDQLYEPFVGRQCPICIDNIGEEPESSHIVVLNCGKTDSLKGSVAKKLTAAWHPMCAPCAADYVKDLRNINHCPYRCEVNLRNLPGALANIQAKEARQQVGAQTSNVVQLRSDSAPQPSAPPMPESFLRQPQGPLIGRGDLPSAPPLPQGLAEAHPVGVSVEPSAPPLPLERLGQFIGPSERSGPANRVHEARRVPRHQERSRVNRFEAALHITGQILKGVAKFCLKACSVLGYTGFVGGVILAAIPGLNLIGVGMLFCSVALLVLVNGFSDRS